MICGWKLRETMGWRPLRSKESGIEDPRDRQDRNALQTPQHPLHSPVQISKIRGVDKTATPDKIRSILHSPSQEARIRRIDQTLTPYKLCITLSILPSSERRRDPRIQGSMGRGFSDRRRYPSKTNVFLVGRQIV